HKGAAGSVREVIESFGGSVEICEWWQQQPPGPPHTFELTLSLSGRPGVDPSARYVEAVIAEVNRTKPVRAHFIFIQQAQFAQPLGTA
ncbi:phage tail protein I, partial [bacterium M00.F.Ca.ET.229.01.1.1]